METSQHPEQVPADENQTNDLNAPETNAGTNEPTPENTVTEAADVQPEVVEMAQTGTSREPTDAPENLPEVEAVAEPVTETTPEPVEAVAHEPIRHEGPQTEPPIEEKQIVPAHESVAQPMPADEEHEELTEAMEEIGDGEYGANLEQHSREKLVGMLEELVKNEDVNDIKSRVALLKFAYINATKKEHTDKLQAAAASEEAEDFDTSDPLEERYKAAFNIYKANKARFNDDQEKQKLVNLEAKKKILEDLKNLVSSEETLKKTYDEFRALQEQWKAIGMVPKTEINGLWQNYHFLIEKFFDKVKINKELKDLDLRKNLERKMELCEKAEELLIETSITKAFKRLQELHDEWKDVGPVAQEKRDEIWERFKSATEKINDRRHEFFRNSQAEFEANFAAKTVLCEQAEQTAAGEYNSLKEWQDSTQKVNDLLKMWKSIGPAPSKVNNEVWNRFKGSLDQYFSAKKEFFGKIKDQHLHNYNLKLELCLQAESHKMSTDWRNSSRELIRLQDEWKKTGPVPRKHSEKIWKRFRSACDEFFNAKNEYFKNAHQSEAENLVKKRALIDKLVAFEFDENRQESLNKVKEIQREWMDTGHVPIKEKDAVQSDYRAAVNKVYEKLKVDAMEAGQMNYRSRFDNLKDQPDAVRIINRERTGLQSKIESLREEILLWENNIGFFANSKQANMLKKEFENKIERAKEELKSLESKMKFLRHAAQDQANPPADKQQ